MHVRNPALVALVSLLAVGCGGVTDDGLHGTGAAAGSAGTAGSAGGAGGSGATGGNAGTGGGTGSCPPAVPAHDAPCADEGLQCTYGECCPTFAQCQNSKWQVAQAPCAAPICPEEPPTAGSSCQCLGDISCKYEVCESGVQVTEVRQCNGDTWEASGSSNGQPCAGVDCGGKSCAPGQICVQTYQGFGVTFACENDPCGSQPLSCACAGKLCQGPGLVCDGTPQPDVLQCSCPVCA